MSRELPELSPFELQCLNSLWRHGEASVRRVQADFPGGAGYSTFRKIFERLERKGAIERVRRAGRAWVYRPAVPSSGILRREIRRLVDGLFGGRGGALLAHLADMDALTLEDLREAEQALKSGPPAGSPSRRPGGAARPRRSRR